MNATRTRSRCVCGKVKSRYAHQCRQCAESRHETAIAEAQKIVDTGICPSCGAKLKRNSSLTGWWQCEQFGAEGFRKDSSKPSCGFQRFTA